MGHRSQLVLVSSCSVLFASLTLLASPAGAEPAPKRGAEAASAPATCAPSCRSGYTCVQGQCVSACNPVCGADEQCTASGECLKTSPPSPVVASLAPTPPLQAPAAALRAPEHASPAIAPAPPSTAAAPATDQPAAAPSEKGVRRHDGFYFRGALGGGFVASGSFTPPAAKGTPTDIGISGAGPAVDLAFGGTVYEGLVVGGGIFGASLPSPSYSASGLTANGGSATVSSLGPFADWYFDPTQGFHALAGIGYAVIAAAKGTPTATGGTTITMPDRDQSGSGVSLTGGVGYEWWVSDQWGLGVLARVQYVTGSVKGDGQSDSTSVQVLIPSVSLSATYN
jgi:hypothetical protein